MAGGYLWETFQKVLKCTPQPSKQSRLVTILWDAVIRRGWNGELESVKAPMKPRASCLNSCCSPGSTASHSVPHLGSSFSAP